MAVQRSLAGTRVHRATERARRVAPRGVRAVFIAVVLAGVTATAAQAAFTRPFVRQIRRTPNGPITLPGGVAVDAEDHLWLGEGQAENRLDEFGTAAAGNNFLTALEVNAFSFPESLAIEQGSAKSYLIGANAHGTGAKTLEVFDAAGNLLEAWPHKVGGKAQLTIDNSSNIGEDPAACTPGGCTVYVAHTGENPAAPEGNGQPNGVEKFDPHGEPVAFSGSAPYIHGNEITGTDSGPFGFEEPRSVAVDARGDIFVVVREYADVGSAVIEYAPSGVMVRAFEGTLVAPLDESRENGGWGGVLRGVAIDPVSNHLLVSVTHAVQGLTLVAGAVDEFDVDSGQYLNQFSATEREVAPGVNEPDHLRSAFALTVDSVGSAYVVDQQQEVVDVYGAGRFLPTLRLRSPSDAAPTSIVLHGEIDPGGQAVSECAFEYVADAAFEQTGWASAEKAPFSPPAASISPAGGFTAVEAALSR